LVGNLSGFCFKTGDLFYPHRFEKPTIYGLHPRKQSQTSCGVQGSPAEASNVSSLGKLQKRRVISIRRFRKSGQFKVRTQLKEKLSQLRLPGICGRGFDCFSRGKCSSKNRVISICRFGKSGHLNVRTEGTQKTVPVAIRRDQQRKRWALVRCDPAESETLQPIVAESKSAQFRVRTTFEKPQFWGPFSGASGDLNF